MLLAAICDSAGRADLAIAAWHLACRYLIGYGRHKDATVLELLDRSPLWRRSHRTRWAQCLR